MKTRFMAGLSLSLCLLLCACGGSSSSSSFYSAINGGNWALAACKGQKYLDCEPGIQYVTNSLGGSLAQSGGQVSGILHMSNSACFDPIKDDIVLSGRFDGNLLTLTSKPVNNQIITLLAQGNGNQLFGFMDQSQHSPIIYGYTVTGGCDDGDYGTFKGTLVQPITGNWSSTYQEGGGNSITAAANFTQAATADAHGRFPLTGTITFTGSNCSTQATIGGSGTSAVWGSSVVFGTTTTDIGGGQGAQNFAGALNTQGTIVGIDQTTGGVCTGNSSYVTYSPQQ